MVDRHESKVKLPPLSQIGIVVKDMDKAIEYYSSTFSWGPFNILDLEIKEFDYKGKLGDCRLKIALAHSGPVEIELIQVLEGKIPHTEFLEEKGEGVHHLGFYVDDLDVMLADLAKEGIEPVFYKAFPGMTIAYMNTDRIGGVMMELIEIKKLPQV